jgi:hypothetical protein
VDKANNFAVGSLAPVAHKPATHIGTRRLAAVSGPVVYYDLTPRQRVLVHVFYLTAWATYAMNRYILRVGSMVQGGNFVTARWALESIGGFNTAISFYGEDTDIAASTTSARSDSPSTSRCSRRPAASKKKACSPWPGGTASTTCGPPSSSAPTRTPTSTSARSSPFATARPHPSPKADVRGSSGKSLPVFGTCCEPPVCLNVQPLTRSKTCWRNPACKLGARVQR